MTSNPLLYSFIPRGQALYNHCLWYIIKQENQWGVALSFENTHKFVIKIPKCELVATLSSTLVKTFGYFKQLFIFNLFLKENEGCDVPFDWVAVCGSTSTTINIIELL